MSKKLFRGTYTAIVTPFKDDGSVDYETFQKLIDRQIEGGVTGIVFVGTTGESPTLSHDEHVEILNWSVKAVNKRCACIHGTGSNSTKEAVYLSKNSQSAGADGLLIVSPYYNKPTQEGLYQHFTEIARSVNLPIILYNIKGRTQVNIETSTLLRLTESLNIVGVKEASGDIEQMMDVIRKTSENFCVLSGDDSLTLPLIALGGDGIISVASNYLPKSVSQYVNYCLDGNFDEARKLHYKLLDVFRGSFIETNPIPAKEILSIMGLMNPNVRLPLCRVSSVNFERLNKLVEYIKNESLC